MKNFFNIQLDGEEWRDIPGTDGVYQASTLGRVRRAACRMVKDDGIRDVSAMILSQKIGYGGMPQVFISHRFQYVREVMVRTFIDHAYTCHGKWIRHRDGDFMNCRPDNLCVCDAPERVDRKRLPGFMYGMIVRSGDITGKFVKYKDGAVHLETPAPVEVSPAGLRRLSAVEFDEWNAGLMNRPMGHRLYYSPNKKAFGFFFEPFDKVISRSSVDEPWCADFYSHCIETAGPGEKAFICMRGPMLNVLPYNDVTSGYIGTTNPNNIFPCD